MAKYKVVEKFVSINGEGTKCGQLAVFIRFQGCNLSCGYCDTMWANVESASYEWMTHQEIYEYIKDTKVSNVTLTGGEPLLQKDIKELIILLETDDHISVEIETNGSVDLKDIGNLPARPSFTMDYKLPSSNMEAHMNLSNFKYLTARDTVKFVAGSMEDLKKTKDIIKQYHLVGRCHLYISPVFGEIELNDIVEFMKENHMNGVNLQMQLHKVIWNPELRGV